MTTEKQPIKIEPGSPKHFTLLGAPYNFNLLTGKDRQDVLSFAHDVWAAALASAQAQQEPQRLDFSQPLETEDGQPVTHICHDVVEFKCARICVDQQTGIVYSSPYVGLKIRNTAPPVQQAEPRAAKDANLLDVLIRMESAFDWFVGRSGFTQSEKLKGLEHSAKVRKEVYAAHDAVRAAIAATKKE